MDSLIDIILDVEIKIITFISGVLFGLLVIRGFIYLLFTYF